MQKIIVFFNDDNFHLECPSVKQWWLQTNYEKAFSYDDDDFGDYDDDYDGYNDDDDGNFYLERIGEVLQGNNTPAFCLRCWLFFCFLGVLDDDDNDNDNDGDDDDDDDDDDLECQEYNEEAKSIAYSTSSKAAVVVKPSWLWLWWIYSIHM